MGIATERRLATISPHDKATVRGMEPITSVVTDSQILHSATAEPVRRVVPLVRRRGPTLSDLVSQNFFAEGSRQEASGVYQETEHVRVRSFDRVPRRWWPGLLALCLVAGAIAAGAWWLGLRPPAAWQSSPAWHTLHLPPMAAPAQPRWQTILNRLRGFQAP